MKDYSNMKREELALDKEYVEDYLIRSYASGTDEYEHVRDTINSVDEADGGSDNTLIIKRLSDNKFFATDYTEWDLQEDDFMFMFDEVFPEEHTIIVYK